MFSKAYNAYRYLYYRIYAWNLRTWGESDMPQFNALFGVSFLIFTNVMTLLTAFEVFSGRHVSFNRAVTIGTGLAFVVLGYFLLVHKAKYRKIVKTFSGEPPAQRRRRFVACVVYVTLSFVSFFWLVKIRNS